MKEYVVYKGEAFTIEWYYNENDESQPLEYFNNLTPLEQQKKTQKLPKQEKLLALKYKADYEKRVKEGTYYDDI